MARTYLACPNCKQEFHAKARPQNMHPDVEICAGCNSRVDIHDLTETRLIYAARGMSHSNPAHTVTPAGRAATPPGSGRFPGRIPNSLLQGSPPAFVASVVAPNVEMLGASTSPNGTTLSVHVDAAPGNELQRWENRGLYLAVVAYDNTPGTTISSVYLRTESGTAFTVGSQATSQFTIAGSATATGGDATRTLAVYLLHNAQSITPTKAFGFPSGNVVVTFSGAAPPSMLGVYGLTTGQSSEVALGYNSDCESGSGTIVDAVLDLVVLNDIAVQVILMNYNLAAGEEPTDDPNFTAWQSSGTALVHSNGMAIYGFSRPASSDIDDLGYSCTLGSTRDWASVLFSQARFVIAI